MALSQSSELKSSACMCCCSPFGNQAQALPGRVDPLKAQGGEGRIAKVSWACNVFFRVLMKLEKLGEGCPWQAQQSVGEFGGRPVGNQSHEEQWSNSLQEHAEPHQSQTGRHPSACPEKPVQTQAASPSSPSASAAKSKMGSTRPSVPAPGFFLR